MGPLRSLTAAIRVAGMLAVAGAAACGNSPKYTLPSVSPVTHGVVTVTQAVSGTTVQFGTATEDLCVLASVQGAFRDYGAFTTLAPDDAGEVPAANPDDHADADATAEGGSALLANEDAADDASFDATLPLSIASGVSLYVSPSGTWSFTAQGSVAASAACVPWSAFTHASSPVLSQYENGGSSTTTEATNVGGQGDCFLSALQGDYSDNGNGAFVDSLGLTVANPAGNPTWAAAICFDGGAPIAFSDFSLDARTQTAFVQLPNTDQALCGIVSLSAMNATESSVTISGNLALGSSSLTAIRCFYYK